jgi:hypothetical protein
MSILLPHRINLVQLKHDILERICRLKTLMKGFN